MQQTSIPPIPASRITKTFDRAQNENRGVLIPYFMCGYPSAHQSCGKPHAMLPMKEAGSME